MNLEVSKYLKQYIQDKFPMYYVAMDKKELMKLMNRIASNALVKKQTVSSIIDGSVNRIIDGVIEDYAKYELTNIWGNFDSVCEYIRSVVIKDEPKILKMVNKVLFDEFIKDIAVNQFANNDFDYRKLETQEFDALILRNFYACVDRIKKHYAKRIGDVSSRMRDYAGSKVYEYLLDRILNSMLLEIDVNEMDSTRFEEKIKRKLNEYLYNDSKKLKKYVESVIIDNIEMNDLNLINVNSTAEFLAKKLLINEEIDICSFLRNKASSSTKKEMNKYILSHVRNSIRANDPEPAKRRIRKCNSYQLSDEQLDKLTDEILKILHVDSNLSYSEIGSGNYDNAIKGIFENKVRKMYMLYNSVENEHVPKRVKREPKKRKLPFNWKKLLIISALFAFLSVSTVVVANEIISGVSQNIADIVYNNASKQMSGNCYSTIFTKYNDGYKKNAKAVIEDYNKYSSYGEEYGYIGFYEAYKHTGSDRLSIMDDMLDDVRSMIVDSENNLKIDDFCFLEFAYNRLVEMGNKEIQQKKYVKAIDGYIEAYFKNNDPNKTTMDYIEENDIGLYNTIVKMMDIYDKESAYCYRDLVILSNGQLLVIGKGNSK